MTLPQTTADDPGDRGVTRIADKVVEKIASWAAVDIEAAAGITRIIAGRPVGSQTVRTRADTFGSTVALSMDLAVHYPNSARAVTREVRTHVAERVTELCSMTVDHIDITVAVLRRPVSPKRRVQ